MSSPLEAPYYQNFLLQPTSLIYYRSDGQSHYLAITGRVCLCIITPANVDENNGMHLFRARV